MSPILLYDSSQGPESILLHLDAAHACKLFDSSQGPESILSHLDAAHACKFVAFADVLHPRQSTHFDTILFREVTIPLDGSVFGSRVIRHDHELFCAPSALSRLMDKNLEAVFASPFARSCLYGGTISTTPELSALIDSGANVHILSWDAAMTLFQSFGKSSLTVVGVNGSATPADVSGVLTITVRGPTGSLYSFNIGEAHGMRQCPMNLLSLSLLIDIGCVFHFDKVDCWMECPHTAQDGGPRVRIPLERVDGLFKLPIYKSSPASPPCTRASFLTIDNDGNEFHTPIVHDLIDSAMLHEHEADLSMHSMSIEGTSFMAGDLDLWHRRMRHVDKSTLKRIHQQGLIDGFHIRGNNNAACGCDSCNQAKIIAQRSERYRRYPSPAKSIGEHVSSDVKSLPFSSFLGYRYVVNFVDHFSGLGMCYCMTNKSEVTAMFKVYCATLHHHGFRVKNLHSDRGSEYFANSSKDDTLAALDRYCASCTPIILHTVTPVESHEFVAESWFHDHFRAAEVMLWEARLSPAFWADAVLYSQYVYNRMPNSKTGPSTPWEMLTGTRARWDKLRVFGSDVYQLIPNDKLRKVPGIVKGRKVIFVGFRSDMQGYKVFDPETREYRVVDNCYFYEGMSHRIDALRSFDKRRDLMNRGLPQPVQIDDWDDVGATTVRNIYSNSDIRSKYAPDIEASGHTLATGASTLTTPASQSLNRSSHDLPIPSVLRSVCPSPDIPVASDTNIWGAGPHFISHPQHISSGSRGVASVGPNAQVPTSQPVGLPISTLTDAAHPVADVWGDHDSYLIPPQQSRSALRGETPKLGPRSDPAGGDISSDSTRSPPDGPYFDKNNNSISSAILRTEVTSSPTLEAPSRTNDLPYPILPFLSNSEEILTPPIPIQLPPRLEIRPVPEMRTTPNDRRARDILHSAENLRPLRLFPIGKAAKFEPQDDHFCRYARTHHLPVLYKPNAKKTGSISHVNYQRYSQASTLQEAIDLGASWADIKWDYAHGFIMFPTHESLLPGHVFNVIDAAGSPTTRHIYDLVALHTTPSHAVDHELTIALSGRLPEGTYVFNDLIKNTYAQILLPEELDNKARADRFSDYQFCKVMNAQSRVNIDFSLSAEPLRWEDTLPAVCSESEQWREAMNDEIWSMNKFGVYKKLPRSAAGTRQVLGCKWIYKRKTNEFGEVHKFRARLVAQGFRQKEYDSYDPDKTYSPVVSKDTLRLFLSISAAEDLIIYQADVKAAFLQAPLDEKIFMRAPPGYDERDPVTNDPMVWELSRAIYGLKQSSHSFWNALSQHLKDNGFEAMMGDPCLFRKEMPGGGVILVATYVDDLSFAVSKKEYGPDFMKMLRTRFEVDEGEGAPIKWLLGIAIVQDILKGTVRLNMETAITKFALGVLTPEEIVKSMDVTTPMCSTSQLPKLEERQVSESDFDYLSVVGSLLHIANCVRCDISQAVGVLSRHSLKPGKAHVRALRRVVMYLYNTRSLGITYLKQIEGSLHNTPVMHEGAKHPLDNGSNLLQTFADSDYAGDLSRRSTHGSVIIMNGGPIAWNSTLGKTVATSTCEAEINAAVVAAKEAVHINKLLFDLKVIEKRPLQIAEDNAACIAQANNGIRHVRNAKHYEVKLAFLQQLVADEVIQFVYCPTNHQVADFFTKPLAEDKFIRFRKSLLS
jgi:hypothetical protein